MPAIKNISLNSATNLKALLDEYCENVEVVPTEQGKAFFTQWTDRVPAKLIRQCIFAGIYWAMAHPEDVIVETEE